MASPAPLRPLPRSPSPPEPDGRIRVLGVEDIARDHHPGASLGQTWDHGMKEEKLTITISKTGPYKVEGGAHLVNDAGEPLETREGKPFFLCRCGHSKNKPFCDGTHNREEWDPELAKS